MNRCRVFLIDDHAVVREGLRLLIEAQSDLKVVGETGVGRDAVDAVRRAGGADVALLDISMPDMSGTQVAAELHAALPSLSIVALTRHPERAYIQQMLRHGTRGYVLKQTTGDVLLSAIRTVRAGGTYLGPAVAARVVNASWEERHDVRDDLTPREREVLVMVAYGHTNKEIASVLGITVKTVETHKANGMQKLNISSRAELVAFALDQNWLQRPT